MSKTQIWNHYWGIMIKTLLMIISPRFIMEIPNAIFLNKICPANVFIYIKDLYF